MGALLQIRDVPDDTRRALKVRAAARGESLNRYLLRLIERDVAQPTVAEVLDRAARRAEQAPSSAVDALDEARREREGRLSPRRR
jgi:plasmid stability protein